MAELCFQKIPAKKAQLKTNNTAARAAFLTESLWPVGATIKIYFIDPIDTQLNWKIPLTKQEEFLDPLYKTIQGKVDAKTLVQTVINERLAKIVNLKFEFTTDVMQSDIRILFKKGVGCSSVVGNSRRLPKLSKGTKEEYSPAGQPEPTMFYSWLDVSTVLHEFGHALGMVHEHQNPQGNPIRWNTQAVYCEFKTRNPSWSNDDIYQNVIEPYETSRINGSVYDPLSIMIYSFPATTFGDPDVKTTPNDCKNKTLPLTLNEPQLEINPNYKLSIDDIKWLKIMYPEDGKRDPDIIKNISTAVSPGSTYQLANTNEIKESAKKFFQNNWKYIAGFGGGLLGLAVLTWIYNFISGKKKTKRVLLEE